MKTCTRCHASKDSCDFYLLKTGYIYPECKVCHRTRRAIRQRLFYTGCTPEKYQELWKKQDGLCAICQLPANNFKKGLAADHDHITKNIRGLLCGKCNVGLGHFNDSLSLLEKAKTYLQTRQPAALDLV